MYHVLHSSYLLTVYPFISLLYNRKYSRAGNFREFREIREVFLHTNIIA